jgi:predicted membrane metal-binding protein
MILRWRYFLGAVVLAAYLLITHGAPPAAVAAGIAGAALFMWRQDRASRLS